MPGGLTKGYAVAMDLANELEMKRRVRQWEEKWRAIGLSTEPADRPQAEKYLRDAYRSVKLAPPKRVLWVDSPLQALIAIFFMNLYRGKGIISWPPQDLASRVFDPLRGKVFPDLKKKAGPCVVPAVFLLKQDVTMRLGGPTLRQLIEPSLWTMVDREVWAATGDRFRSQFDDTALGRLDELAWRRLCRRVDNAVDVRRRQDENDIRTRAMKRLWDRSSSREQAVSLERADKRLDVEGDVASRSFPDAVASREEARLHRARTDLWRRAAPAGRQAAERLERAALQDRLEEYRQTAWEATVSRVESQIRTFVDAMTLVPRQLPWISRFDLWRCVACPDEFSEAEGLFGLTATCGGWVLAEDMAILIERPIHVDIQQQRLQTPRCPIVAYRDGFRVWAIRSVHVPQSLMWILTEPADRLDPMQILRLTNVEIRRVFVERVGIERLCEALHAECLDRQGDYRLLLLDLRDGRFRPYLKMKNPSTGAWHIEGVHPNCQTVAEALQWRNRTDETPHILT